MANRFDVVVIWIEDVSAVVAVVCGKARFQLGGAGCVK
jgi:hypothetical protein